MLLGRVPGGVGGARAGPELLDAQPLFWPAGVARAVSARAPAHPPWLPPSFPSSAAACFVSRHGTGPPPAGLGVCSVNQPLTQPARSRALALIQLSVLWATRPPIPTRFRPEKERGPSAFTLNGGQAGQARRSECPASAQGLRFAETPPKRGGNKKEGVGAIGLLHGVPAPNPDSFVRTMGVARREADIIRT